MSHAPTVIRWTAKHNAAVDMKISKTSQDYRSHSRERPQCCNVESGTKEVQRNMKNGFRARLGDLCEQYELRKAKETWGEARL